MADPRPPLHAAPEILKDGSDVSRLTDRALLVDIANKLIEFRAEYDRDKGGLMREFAQMGRRLLAVELGPMRQPADSVTDLLQATGEVLSHRAKDPRDKMDSDRAKAIAREVYEASKNAEDAAALRGWRKRGWGIALEIVKVVIAAAVGAAAVKFGWPG